MTFRSKLPVLPSVLVAVKPLPPLMKAEVELVLSQPASSFRLLRHSWVVPLVEDRVVSATTPLSLTTSWLAPVESVTLRAAGSLSTLVSLALSLKAVSTMRAVAEDIAVIVLVSPETVILSPTWSSVVKKVPTPVTLVEAIGSIEPVMTLVALALMRLEPD